MLLQEIYRDDPWKMLIGCILLNLTHRRQAQPVAERLFEKYSNPLSMAGADYDELGEIIRSLGLWRRRTKTLIEFSLDWYFRDSYKPSEVEVKKMHGIGKYAADSYRIFQLGDRTRCESGDSVLLWYLKEVA